MSERPLNLLRYPRRERIVDPVLLRPVFWGLLTGGMLAAAGAGWQSQRQIHLQTQRASLQALVQEQERQQTQARNFRAQQQLLDRMQERVQVWQAQRQQTMQWHAFLGAEAEQTGLRLQRWQGDGRKVTLQLWLPRPELLPSLVARLTEISPGAWTLHSLSGQNASAGVQAVIESAWPAELALTASGRKP